MTLGGQQDRTRDRHREARPAEPAAVWCEDRKEAWRRCGAEGAPRGGVALGQEASKAELAAGRGDPGGGAGAVHR